MMDNVNIIIYPVEYSRKAYAEHWKQGKQEQPGQTAISPTKGRVVDHIAFSVDNLSETIERLIKEGVKITDPIRTTARGRLKHAFIEGPDYIRIELVEGRAHKE
jgi:catechol 2,3-dioxygenase-like lactoylglutathione lyase family enzyme